MPTSPSPYFSYLLRLWLAGDDDLPEWRLALTDPETGQALGFANLEALATFLRAKMGEAPAGEAGKPTGSTENG
jgi:hypothetical protein